MDDGGFQILNSARKQGGLRLSDGSRELFNQGVGALRGGLGRALARKVNLMRSRQIYARCARSQCRRMEIFFHELLIVGQRYRCFLRGFRLWVRPGFCSSYFCQHLRRENPDAKHRRQAQSAASSRERYYPPWLMLAPDLNTP